MAYLSRSVRGQELFEYFGIRVRFCEFREVAFVRNPIIIVVEPTEKFAPPSWRTQFE